MQTGQSKCQTKNSDNVVQSRPKRDINPPVRMDLW